MKRLFLLLSVALLAAYPASAEVCDKVVGEWWRPEHGPIPLPSIYDISGSAWTSVEIWKVIFFAILALVLFGTQIRGGRWIAGGLLIVAAVHSAFVSAVYANDWGPGGGSDILVAAIREGCLFPSLLPKLDRGPPIGIAMAWAATAVGAFHLLSAYRPRGAPNAA